MTRPVVQAVLFDYGGVLRRELAADFDAFAARFGLPPGWLWEAFHAVPEYQASRAGAISDAAYRAGVLRRLAGWLDPAAAEACLAGWEALRARDDALLPEFRTLLAQLKGRVRVGILSNSGRGGRRRLEATGVAALFDDVLCSAEVGLLKPDPAVFRLAAKRLGVPPTACLFVDDQAGHVEAARAVGMRAFHYAPPRHADLLRWLAEEGALPTPPGQGATGSA